MHAILGVEPAVFLSSDSEESGSIINLSDHSHSDEMPADNSNSISRSSGEEIEEEVTEQLDCPQEFSDDEKSQRKALGTLFTSKCCSKNCLLHLTGHEVINARRRVGNISENLKRKWLYEKVSESSRLVGGKLLTTFNLAGQGLCHTAFCLLYSINTKRLNRVIRSISDGDISHTHGNTGRKRKGTKIDTIDYLDGAIF